MSPINREFSRFVFWGGVNTAVGYVIYLLLLRFLPYLVSYTIAFIISIFCSYLLNSKFVFKQKLKWSKAIKYPLVYLAQYLFGTVSLYLLVQILGINKMLAPIFVVVLSIPITYYLGRMVVKGQAETN